MTRQPSEFVETSAHGFEIFGDITLAGLRRQAGCEELRIRRGTVDTASPGITVGHWSAIPHKRAEVSIDELDEFRHRVTIGGMARFMVEDRTAEITAEYAAGLPPILETTLLGSSPVALCIARRGNLALHAGAVEVGNRGVLFAAPGTGGKTTLSAAFHAAGHRSLSDDLVRVDPAGWIAPAPALLRLRSDSAAILEPRLRDAVLLLEDGGKRFYEISSRRRGTGAPVPAAAVMLLAWSSDDNINITEVPARNAIQELWGLTFYLRSEPGPAESFERLAALVDDVPTFVVHRPRDFTRLDECVSLIEEAISGL